MGPISRGKQSKATQAGENFPPEPLLLSTPLVFALVLIPWETDSQLENSPSGSCW